MEKYEEPHCNPKDGFLHFALLGLAGVNSLHHEGIHKLVFQ